MLSNYASRSMMRAASSRSRAMMLRRNLATEAAEASKPAKPATPAPTRPMRKGGAGFFARFSSFLAGAGLTALGTQFYVFQEIKDGNKSMIAKQKELEARIAKLEG
uniref:Uncharacterized protein n=1 Tax=Craspedostauros australis TaxID=1486917 RepID=A0A7R9ZMW6_9STRA|mmetsp:Transcript_19721/g.54856  ORF Transcript_19721/g.54856 Transcript_19721/m.54856 type:complete len:106 (+) Transcript_19721:181-498(+)|eukprot:CAMPEP_0198132894 /NCGR_PEP_ID=MMETSP1442-20131203/59286_1 /TAXON_ID= /ORGANISM="Craspedostauros australis, Strain CCMP3328" /LENGTH=105 /DNA_ID=CAMNT_0043793997 /DNA_START=545 /DNA_END=862 /DNA_ORIENTATION=-